MWGWDPSKRNLGLGDWLKVPFTTPAVERDDHSGRGSGRGRGRGRSGGHGIWMDDDMDISADDDAC